MVIIMRQLFVSNSVTVRVVVATAKGVGHVLQGTVLGGVVQE